MTSTAPVTRQNALRIGFVPLNDSAPLIIAHEKGFFSQRGLRVRLQREIGWATVRDKIIYREIEAAHAPAAMPLAVTLGLGCVRCDCLTAMVLNLNGNAITLSEKLWKRSIRDGASLRQEITRIRHDRLMTFGIVNRFSSHQHLLRQWLRAHGIDPELEVRMVVLPPSQMVANLAAGNLDGFCVGEPWNSVAIKARAGWCVTTSAAIDPFHPEKVLMVRADFAEQREAEHLGLLAALRAACDFCDDPVHAPEIASILARPEYVGAPAEAIEAGLNGFFHFGHDRRELLPDFCVFHRGMANEPTSKRAAWSLALIRGADTIPDSSPLPPNTQILPQVYRSDIFHKANPGSLENKSKHPYEKPSIVAIA